MATELSATQKEILSQAAKTSGGKLTWFPDNLKGGARKKVLHAMSARMLIACKGDDWFLTKDGRASAEVPRPKMRDNSKQAGVIEMLRRPEGATITQITEATGWQAHTVRGAFAGAFKKKLGLVITSTKAEGEERVYRTVD